MQSALQAQQAGIDVTGQNIANVNTPGYVKRTAVLETQATLPGNEGGVNVSEIQRAFNQFTYGQVLVQHGQQGAADERSSALGEAQAVVTPQGGGSVSDAMNGFFSSLQTLTASPSDPSARSAVLAQATQLAQTFSRRPTWAKQQKTGVFQQAQGVAGQVNQDLAQIAQLNTQIATATAAGQGAPDLQDSRDALVTDVANKVGARVVQDPSGSVTLFAAGSVLVSGNSASTMTVAQDSSGALKFTVAQKGGAPTDVTGQDALSRRHPRGARHGHHADRQPARPARLRLLDLRQRRRLDRLRPRRSLRAQPLHGPHASRRRRAEHVGRPGGRRPARQARHRRQRVGRPGRQRHRRSAVQASPTRRSGAGGTPAATFGAIAGQLGTAKSQADTDSATRADMVAQAENSNSRCRAASPSTRRWSI